MVVVRKIDREVTGIPRLVMRKGGENAEARKVADPRREEGKPRKIKGHEELRRRESSWERRANEIGPTT